MVGENKKVAKIEIDRELCIGAASCVAIAPEIFALDSEGKAYAVKQPSDGPAAGDMPTNEDIILAAKSCPTKAIILYDEDGKQIYPQ